MKRHTKMKWVDGFGYGELLAMCRDIRRAVQTLAPKQPKRERRTR